jgi:hypothetical protein
LFISSVSEVDPFTKFFSGKVQITPGVAKKNATAIMIAIRRVLLDLGIVLVFFKNIFFLLKF